MAQRLCVQLFAVTFAVAGCSSHPRPIVTSAAPTGIVYRVAADHIDATRKLAGQHCADHNKRARFEQVTDGGRETVIAAFRCV
jgi:hypothetical protein